MDKKIKEIRNMMKDKTLEEKIERLGAVINELMMELRLSPFEQMCLLETLKTNLVINIASVAIEDNTKITKKKKK